MSRRKKIDRKWHYLEETNKAKVSPGFNKSLKYITRQGIALQGHNNNDNFIQLLHLLGTKNEIIVKHLDEHVGYKCNHLVQSQVQSQQATTTSTTTLKVKIKSLKIIPSHVLYK